MSESIPKSSTSSVGRHYNARKIVSSASVAIMFIIGVSTTCLAPLLIGNVIYVLTRIVISSTTLPGTLARYAHIAALSQVSFGIVFNFIMACGVHPGWIPDIYIDACKSYLAKNPDAALRFCEGCNVPKAPRSHHCSMCGTNNGCILKMDHHCPWINGCVGYHNYRYFFGFLLWLLAGTIYSFSSCAYMLWFHDPVYAHAFEKVSGETNQVFFIFVLTVAIAITMCLYVGFNVYGIYHNLSAVEFHISKEVASNSGGNVSVRNPYNIGPLKNAIECLGPETTPWQINFQHLLRFVFAPMTSTSTTTSSSSLVNSVVSVAVKMLRVFWLTLPNIQLMPHEGVWFPTASAGGVS